MDIVSPWWRIIWVFVAIGECLGVVPSSDHPYLPGAISERTLGGPIAIVVPEADRTPRATLDEAAITLTTEAGLVTIHAATAQGGGRRTEIPPRVFAACADAPCPACPDGSAAVPDLSRINEVLTQFKTDAGFAEVRSIVISAHEDTLYEEIVHLLDVSRAAREFAEDATPCDVLAAKQGDELFPNVVFSAKE